jgi:hypothetical protein
MMMLVDLNVSWRKVLMSAKDFVTMSEIMSRSNVVETNYIDDKQYAVTEDHVGVHASQFKGQLVTKEAYDALKSKNAAAEA